MNSYLDKYWGPFRWVPKEFHSVKLSGVSPGVYYTHWHGDICNRSVQKEAVNKQILDPNNLHADKKNMKICTFGRGKQ